MPIGGFVVTVIPERSDEAERDLASMEGVEIHGRDDKGNLVVVVESDTSEAMEQLVKEMSARQFVLSVGLVYFHAEDEVASIESGKYVPSRSFGRKGEKE